MKPTKPNYFRRYLLRRNFSRYTVRNYMRALSDFRQSIHCRLSTVTYVEVAQYVEHLQAQGLAAKTINCRLSAVRQFYDFLKQDYLPHLVNPIRERSFLKEPHPLPCPASEEELSEFFAQIHSVRDRALCLILLRSGLRVAEVVSLEVQDVDLRRQTLLVREGKGRRGRLVYLSNDTITALQECLRSRSWRRESKLFVSEKGQNKGRSLSIRGVQKRIQTYARRAGVTLSGHRLRHSFATQLLNQGVRLVALQELLGHAQIATTQRYARLANRRVREEYFAGMNKILKSIGAP